MKITPPLHKPTKGILLIALGSPQYGCYAANLAASIRVNDPALPIHLVHTEESISRLTAAHQTLFTSMAICPEQAYVLPATSQLTTNTRTQFIRAKTHMYDLSPFDETLFLDVDTMMLPGNSLEKFITELSSACDFTIENRGYADLHDPKPLKDYSVWCDVDALRAKLLPDLQEAKYPLRYYNLHSELAFFKKNAANKIFFDKVKEVYDAPPIAASRFDTGMSDEFAFSTAMILLGYYPHQDHYIRIFWNYMEKNHDWHSHVTKNFIGYSLGGNMLSPMIAERTKAYTSHFRQKLNLPYLFTPQHKKVWNRNRDKW